MKYDAKYFIKKFDKIPEDKWFNKKYHNEEKTKFCAFGHCGGVPDIGIFNSQEALALQDLFNRNHLLVHKINDGEVIGYCFAYNVNAKDLGDTPKERILNTLVLIDSGILNEN